MKRVADKEERVRVLSGEVHFWVVSLAKMEAPEIMSVEKIPEKNEEDKRR